VTARIRIAAGVLAVASTVGLQLAVPASPAAAASSQITFVTGSPLATAFGGNWTIELATVFGEATDYPIPADQATVDVYVSGRAEPYATRLPIQPDGHVYVSQAATAVLPPGEYQVTAQIVPVAGSYVEGSQTTTPLVLSIAALAVDASITMDEASVAAGEPVLEASLSGEFVDTTGSVPAGTWAFTVSSRGKTVLETEVAQGGGSDDALRYAITETLDRGTDYTVSAEFTPIDALAAGLEVTQPSDATFHTPGGGIGDPIPYPLWLLIVTCLVPLGLAAAVIVLTVRLGRASAVVVGPDAAAAGLAVTPVGGSPIAAEQAWDPFSTAHAAQPEAPTQVPPPQQFPPQQSVAPQQSPTEVFPPQRPTEPTFTELIQPVQPTVWSLGQEDEDEQK